MRRLLSEAERLELLVYMQERFGLEQHFFDQYFFERTKRDIWLVPHCVEEGFSPNVVIEKRGMRAFNSDKHPPKPTTAFLQRFGHKMNKSRVELDALSFSLFLNGQTNPGLAVGISNGYVLVTYYQMPIGCGFAREGNLESQFPQNTGRSINHKNL